MNKLAYIFLNNPIVFQDQDFIKQLIKSYNGDIFAVDGGAILTFKLGLNPKYIVGDLDSIDVDVLTQYKDNLTCSTEFLTFPAEKDQNDTELLLEYLIKNGYSKIIIFGMLGGRYDHSLFNIFLHLKYRQIIAVDSLNCCLTLSKHQILKFTEKQTVSFFPLSYQVTGLTLQGFKYPTQNLTITQGNTLTLSNETKDSQCVVSFTEGKLLGCFNFNILTDMKLFNQLLEI